MPRTLPPLASVEDLADWIGEAIANDEGDPDGKRAAGVLSMASGLVRDETGKSWLNDAGDGITSSLPDDVINVTCAAAGRAYLNPEGFEQERQDDFYGSRKVPEAGVFLTRSEKDLLVKYAGDPHGGLRTIATTRNDYPILYPDHEVDEPLLPPYYP